MNRLACLLIMCSATLATAQPAATRPADRSRPNILFILTDDLGPEWLSCYGGQEVRTPNIDRLAEQGTLFRNCWATPLCTPTRMTLLTGRYPFRTGWINHHDVPRWGGPGFDPAREVAFPRLLREAGYATAVSGKWQINDLRTDPDILRKHGFDEHCMWPGFEEGNPGSEERYFDPYLQTNGQRKVHTGRFGPDVLADFTVDFMRRHKDGPFLAYHAMVLTHTPMTATPANKDAGLKGAALHPGMVQHMDAEVGRLLATLDDLKIADRTVVIYATDNGSPGLQARCNGRRVVGAKGKLLETGINVPLIVRGPGIAHGTSHALVDFSDFFPTLLDLAHVRRPANLQLDGRSFAGIAGQGGDSQPREWIYSQLGTDRVVRDQRYKLWSKGRLYDVNADRDEELDLSGSTNPDVIAARDKLQRVLDSLPPDAPTPYKPRKESKPGAQ